MERPKRIFEDFQIAKLLFSYLLTLNSRCLAFMLHSFFIRMEIFKSKRSFYVFYTTLRKTFFILKMTKRIEKTFKIPEWQFSSQADRNNNSEFIFFKKITR